VSGLQQEVPARAGEAAGADGPPHAGAIPPRGLGYLASLSLATLGVVYGDIGTSPLYAMRECFFGEAGIAPTPANVMGVLSLIVWTLIVVISIKYLAFILRADNRGEGGIMALLALVGSERQRHPLFIFLGLFGAALLYGDGMITPAISVLSAVEGLGVATEVFHPYIVPITVVLLIGLFVVQRHGTARVGAVFGPVTLVWFVVLAALGIGGIMDAPQVLAAVSPTYAISFFMHNGTSGFFVLGGVFLVTTGGEALYADMGHVGKRPIRLMWFTVVLPGLLLNYFGQGALLLRDPDAGHNPFYHLAPEWALYPLVTLAAMATIIASQAVISGAFSLTRQAIRLGYCPPLEVTHTSSAEIGQIYIARINWVLMVATIGLVLGFRSSSNLAAAYGVAVATTMVITTMLFFVLTRELWHWPLWQAALLCGGLLAVDVAFFGANAVKLFDLASGSELQTLPRTAISTGGASSSFLAFSPDSTTLAVVLGDTVKLFNVASGQETGTIVSKGTQSILFSPDGQSLYAGGWNGITVWDVASGAQIRSMGDMSSQGNCLALSPDGTLLASGGSFDQPIVLWEAATGRQLRTFAGHTGGIKRLIFSPDGKLLASSAGDVTIKLWDVASGKVLQTLVGHTQAATDLAFSPDGATMVSIGYDQGVWLWGLPK